MYKSITFKITATIKCYKDPAGRIIEVNSKTSTTQKIFCQFKVSVVGEHAPLSIMVKLLEKNVLSYLEHFNFCLLKQNMLGPSSPLLVKCNRRNAIVSPLKSVDQNKNEF